MRVALEPSSPSFRAPLWGIVIGVLLGGCTVESDKPRECTGTSYTEYLNKVFQTTIAYEKRCGELDPSGAQDAQRRALFDLTYPSFLTEIRDKAARERRVGYDASDSSCFVSMLRDAPCRRGAVTEAEAACRGKDTFGCLAPGRACQLPEECQEGFCRGIPSGSICGSGICQAKGGVGATCTEGAIACNPKSSYCKGGACQPLEAEGLDCSDDSNCQAGLQCVRTQVGASTGKCQKPRVGMLDEPCSLVSTIGQPCAAGLACYKDAMGAYKCQQAVPVGGDCNTSDACEGTATCVRAAVTDPTGKCRPLGGNGAECSADGSLGSACQKGFGCYSFDPMIPAICQPLPSLNDRCAVPNLDCLKGWCDTSTTPATCRQKSGTGLACRNNNECVSNQCDQATRKCKEPACK